MKRWMGLWLIAGFLTACGGMGSAPQMIGSASKVTSAPVLISDSGLVVEVWDTAYAVEQATRIAYEYGGYVTTSQTWAVGPDPYAVVTLAIPAYQFENVHSALAQLGNVVSDHITNTPVSYDEQRGWFSNITVNFRPIHPEAGGWNPMHTLAQAGGVFWWLFTHAIDGVIWLVVVGGPFVLMALGARAMWKKARGL